MLKTTLLFCLAAWNVFAASPIAGRWAATLDDGKEKVNLSLTITDNLGKLIATLSNSDNSQQIPIQSITFEGGKFEIVTAKERGVYRATLKHDDLSGVWNQDGNSLPLNFYRVPEQVKETLTPAERAFAITYLENNRKEFLDAIRGLNAAQWNYKPKNGGWSVAECAEHITLAEDLLFGLVTKLAEKPADPAAARSGRQKDEQILQAMTDRSKKAKAPEMLVPSGKYPTPDTIIAAFGPKRDRTVAFVRDAKDDLRGKSQPSQLFGSVDAYQYVLFLAGHSARHTAQLLEVKSEAGFPK